MSLDIWTTLEDRPHAQKVVFGQHKTSSMLVDFVF